MKNFSRRFVAFVLCVALICNPLAAKIARAEDDSLLGIIGDMIIETFDPASGMMSTKEIVIPLPDGGYERSTETTIEPSVSGAEVGAIAGAAGGAAIGSFIPIVGTAAGAAIGAIAGGIAGWIFGPAD